MAKNIISIVIAGELRGVKEAGREARNTLNEVETKGQSTSGKLLKYGGAAAAGIAGIALAAAGYAVKMGSELQESQDNLDNALERTHQSMGSFGGGLATLLKQNEKWGHTNAQVYDSLQTLVRAGVPAKKALADQAIAANLAAARHIDLSTATGILTKVETGHVSLLGRLGIQTKDATGKTISQAAALHLLADKYGGAADAAGSTFQGKIAAAKAQLTDTAAKIGVKLIPILLALAQFVVNNVIPAIESIVKWIQTKLIPALTAFALKVADVYNKWVKPVVAGIVQEFRGLFQIVSGIVSLFSDLFHGRWAKVWDDLKQIATGVVNVIVGTFRQLPSLLLKLLGALGAAALKLGGALASGLLHGITGAAGDAASFARSMVNAVIRFFNAHVIDKVDDIIHNGFKVGPVHVHGPAHIIPDIPYLHSGGVFHSAQGEGLAWLQDGERVLSRGETAAYGRGGDFIVHMPAGTDPSAIAAAKRQHDKRNGVTSSAA